MSTNKEQKFFVGVLSILAAAILGHPTAEAAQVLQTAAEETSSVKSNAVEARASEHYTTEPITVGAKRSSWEETLSPGTVTVIHPDQYTGEQKTLADFLKTVPGIHIVELYGRGAYTTATVRGSTAAQVDVYVDGVRMNLGSEAAVDLSTIPITEVERIEVYRGYVPVRFQGSAMGGVINIVTKKPKKSGGSLTVGRRSFSGWEHKFGYNTQLGNGTLLIGLHRDQTQGDFPYLNDNNTPYTPGDDHISYRQNMDYQRTDGLIKWQNDVLAVSASWKKDARTLPYPAPGADRSDSWPGAKYKTQQWTGSLQYTGRWGQFQYGLRLDYLNQDKKYDDPNDMIGQWGVKHNRYRTERWSGGVDGSIPIGNRQFVEFQYQNNYEKLNTRGDIVKRLRGRKWHYQHSESFRIQDTIQVDKEGKLRITPLYRWNAVDGWREQTWEGAINYDITPNLMLKASAGQYNRAPNLYERFGDGAFVIPNRDLRWEMGTQWDVGLVYNHENGANRQKVALTYFQRNSEDLIDYLFTNPRFIQYVNIKGAKVRGMELEGLFYGDGWNVQLALTRMLARNTIDKTNPYMGYIADKFLANRPLWEGSLRVEKSFGRADRGWFFTELHYTGKNFYDQSEEVGWTKLFTVGAGVRYQCSKNTRIVVGVNDIFNQGPETKLFAVGYGPKRMLWYPIQGRSWYASVTYDF